MKVLYFAAYLFLAAAASFGVEANSIWYATDFKLKQVDSATHQTLATISLRYAKALAVDAKDQGLLALTESKIYKYTGSTKLWEKKVSDLGLSKGSLLAANPNDSSLWLAYDKKLVHLDANGKKLHSWSTSSTIKRIVLDPDNSVWVLGDSKFWHYSVEGALLATRSLSGILSSPIRIAVDTPNQYLWVASSQKLARFNLANLSQTPTTVTLPETASNLALDPQSGAVWILGTSRLIAYDKLVVKFFDAKLDTFGLSGGDDDEEDDFAYSESSSSSSATWTMAYDPLVPNLWLAYQDGLAKLAMAGVLQANISASSSVKELGVTPYGKAPPVLSLVFPAPGASINSPLPTIIVGYSDPCAGTCIAPLTNSAINEIATVNPIRSQISSLTGFCNSND